MSFDVSYGGLEQAVLDSVKARGGEVTDADQAAVESALVLARQIDAVPDDAGQERTKVLYLVPHLMKVLASLGCTPEARGAAKAGDVGKKEKLASVSVLDRMKANGKG